MTPSNLIQEIQRLPQGKNSLQLCLHDAPTWIDSPNGLYRPIIAILIDLTIDQVKAFKLFASAPTSDELISFVLNSLIHPTKAFMLAKFGSKIRPAQILVEDEAFAEILTPILQTLQINCVTSPRNVLTKNLLSDFESALNNGRKHMPSLIKIHGVTVPLINELFSAAAAFNRAKPWKCMWNLDAIEIRYPAQAEPVYGIIMGNGGQEYGLAIYRTRADIDMAFSDADNKTNYIKKAKPYGMTFDKQHFLAFEDLDAIKTYGWEVENDKAYPCVTIISTNRFETLNVQEVRLLAATLRAIPTFVKDHLHAIINGQPQPATATLQLPNVHAGDTIMLKYPMPNSIFRFGRRDDLSDPLRAFDNNFVAPSSQ